MRKGQLRARPDDNLSVTFHSLQNLLSSLLRFLRFLRFLVQVLLQRPLVLLFDWLVPPRCLACMSAMKRSASDKAIGRRVADSPKTLDAEDDLRAPIMCEGLNCEGLGCEGICEGCAPLLEEAEGALAAYVYAGPLQQAIAHAKYGGMATSNTKAWKQLGALLANHAVVHEGRVDVVIPVPMHARGYRARGFHHAAVLAAPVADVLGVLSMPWALRRTRHTPRQATLDRAQRLHNLRGVFEADDAVRGMRCLLVDDVITTGATMQAARDALLRGGAAEVYLFSLAQAEVATRVVALPAMMPDELQQAMEGMDPSLGPSPDPSPDPLPDPSP